VGPTLEHVEFPHGPGGGATTLARVLAACFAMDRIREREEHSGMDLVKIPGPFQDVAAWLDLCVRKPPGTATLSPAIARRAGSGDIGNETALPEGSRKPARPWTLDNGGVGRPSKAQGGKEPRGSGFFIGVLHLLFRAEMLPASMDE